MAAEGDATDTVTVPKHFWFWVHRGTLGLPALSFVWSVVTAAIFFTDPELNESIVRATWLQAWIGLAGSALGVVGWFGPKAVAPDVTAQPTRKWKRFPRMAARFVGKLSPVLGVLAAIWAYVWVLLLGVFYFTFTLIWTLIHGLGVPH